MLEIDCFDGRSTIWFLENDPTAHLTCIDPFPMRWDLRFGESPGSAVKSAR
jgi:hypothetical protein